MGYAGAVYLLVELWYLGKEHTRAGSSWALKMTP